MIFKLGWYRRKLCGSILQVIRVNSNGEGVANVIVAGETMTHKRGAQYIMSPHVDYEPLNEEELKRIKLEML